MPTYFVSATTVVTPPNDSNDGLDLFGLAGLGGVFSYNSSTRVLTGANLIGSLSLLAPFVATGLFVAVVSGTGWTKGLYQVEAVDDLAGTITFKAGQSGLGTGTPTLSSGPLATLSAAHGKIPGTVSAPWTDYASANAACRIAIYGTQTFGAKFAWTAVGAVGYNNMLTGCDGGGLISTEMGTLQPTNSFTTPASNPLWQFNAAGAGYLDVQNIVFNAASHNSTKCQYACDLNATIGYLSFTNCHFKNAAHSGLREVSNRVALIRCRAFDNANFGFYTTSTGLASLLMFGCEAHGNTNDGFSIDGTTEASRLIECIAHNNGRDGFAAASSAQSILFAYCIAAANTRHGFNLASSNTALGGYINLIGNISVGNGSTSSHRQFNFSGTTSRTHANVMNGNYAGPAGSTLAFNAGADITSDQILSGVSTVLRNLSVSDFDGRLTLAKRTELRSLVTHNQGVSTFITASPGLNFFAPAGGSGDGRVLNRAT